MALEDLLVTLNQSIIDLTAAARALQPITQASDAAPVNATPIQPAPAKGRKAAPAAPAPMPAPVTAAPAAIDLPTMQRALAGIAEKLGTPQPVVDIMQRQYGVQRLSEIPQEQYSALLAAAQALIA